MAKSRARYLAELLNSDGLVQTSLSALAGADGIIDLEVLPTIPNSQLEHSSVSIAGHTLSLGGSLSLDTEDIGEHASYLYFTNARARAALSVSGSLSYDSATGVISYTTPTTISSLSNHTTDGLTEGATNLYYTSTRANTDFDTRLATKSTTDLSEGTNLYYTDARVGSYLASNSYATQSYVSTAISNLVDSAPATLDTLNELAAALGDDPNFATTVSTSIGLKQDASTALTTSTTFGGDVSGTYNAIVVADDSHNHVISNVDGLQSALDDLTPTSNDTFNGTYPLVWVANDVLYSSTFMTINGATDTLSVTNLSTGTISSGDITATSGNIKATGSTAYLQAKSLILDNGEIDDTDFANSFQMIVDANDSDSDVPGHGDHASSYPFGVYFLGDNDQTTKALGSGLVKLWHTGHFSKAHIDHFVGLYSGTQSLTVPSLSSGAITSSDKITTGAVSGDGLLLPTTGTATSGTQTYNSPDIRLEASGWDTNNSLARTLSWVIRNEPIASIYPDFDLNFIQRANGTDATTFTLHGRGTAGHVDPRAGTFFGDLHVEAGAGTNAGAGDLTVAGAVTVTGNATFNELTLTGGTDNLTFTQSAGDWTINNAQQNNGITIFDGGGGVDINYNGSAVISADSTGIVLGDTVNANSPVYLNDWVYVDVVGQNLVLRSDTSQRETLQWQQGTTTTWSLTQLANGNLNFDPAGSYQLQVDGSTVITAATNTFDNLSGKTSGTGDYSTTGHVISGRDSGGVALTLNDGKGNANVTFNHANGVPEQNGNAARIEVNTDSSTGAAIMFEIKSGVTGGTAVDLTNIMDLDESGLKMRSGMGVYINGTEVISSSRDLTPANITTTGDITLGSGATLIRSTHQSGHLEGGYNNIGNNNSASNPIYTIGSSYNPAATTLDNMYGIGYAKRGSASYLSSVGGTGWGMYVAAAGSATIFLNGDTGEIAGTGGYLVGTTTVIDSNREGSFATRANFGGIDSAGNVQPSASNTVVSGYGVIGNRDTYYITNGGGVIQIGNGSVHNNNPTATFSTSAVNLGSGRSLQMNGTTVINSARALANITSIDSTGDLTIDKAEATIKLGYAAGPHGINFYDTDASTLRWGFYYRTTPETISFEALGTTPRFTLDSSGNITDVTSFTLAGAGSTIQLSGDRTGLIEITDSGQAWTGIQISQSEGDHWSVMGSPDSFGLYDDLNGDWILLYTQGADTALYWSGLEKFRTQSTGARVLGVVDADTGYQVYGTTVIDSSRNLSNIGTISSDGAFKSDSEFAFLTSGGGAQTVQMGGLGIGSSYSSYPAYAGEVNVQTGYRVGGTRVIDSSRNLTNIANFGGGDGNFARLGRTYNTATYFEIGYGSGAVGLTINDGGGNAQLCFNHTDEYADTDGSSARIRCDVDSSGADIKFLLDDSVTAGFVETNDMVQAFTVTTSGVLSSGNVTAYSSDRRLKENFKHIDDPLGKIAKLNGMTFDWKDIIDDLKFKPKHRKDDVGLIAQEVEAVVPQAVAPAPFDWVTTPDGTGYYSKSGQNYMTVQYEKLIPLLVEGIKEQQQQIEELKALIMEMKNGDH